MGEIPCVWGGENAFVGCPGGKMPGDGESGDNGED